MKPSTRIGMTVFVVSACFHGSQLRAAPSKVAPAPAIVNAPKTHSLTRDNFISLWWSSDNLRYTFGDYAPIPVFFTVKANVVRCESRSENKEDKWELTAVLSNNQVNALIDKLNKRQPNEEGKQHKEFPEVLFTLRFSDEDNKDQSADFVFFKDTTQGNIDLEMYLRDLAEMKFPEIFYVLPISPNATANNN